MRGALPWTSLPLALAAGLLPLRVRGQATPAAQLVVPAVSDVGIKTRRTIDRPNSTVATEILFLKGPWQRREQILQFPSLTGPSAEHTSLRITRCDERRTIDLDLASRTFGSSAIDDLVAHPRRLRRVARDRSPDATGANVTIHIDAVDTGERRQVGPFLARHVITTRTTAAEPGANARAGTSVEDGCYIDVPPGDCVSRAQGDAILVGSVVRPGTPPDRVRVEHRGTARRGLPIEETSHSDDGSPESRVALIEISEAPLDAALFTVPAGYRAALPRLHGGFDLTKPDTLVNRLASYWEEAAAWIRSL